MLKNYLKISFRNLLKNKLYSFINIFGLGIGLSSFIIIALFIKHEFSYDAFHKNGDRIYRISEDFNYNGAWHKVAMTPPSFGPTMVSEYPEVENYARFNPYPEVVIGCRDKKYSEKIQFADGGVFTMFSFPVLYGNPDELLKDKYTVVLSESTAKKYFGDKNPIGEIVSFNGTFDLVVTGVFKDIPGNSHLKFNVLVSMSTIEDEHVYGAGALENYTSSNFHNYLMLSPGADINSLQSKMNEFVAKYSGDDHAKKLKPYFEPLSSIYLYSEAIYGSGISGDIKYIYVFSVIALFILLIAAINFVNLTTSQSMTRAKEIGIRKVAGSYRWNLVVQFLGESIFLTIISFLVGLVLLEVFMPFYNIISTKPLVINYFSEIGFFIVLLGISVFVGLLAGLYPAIYLSSFEPSKILKGEIDKGVKGGKFRKALVILQFCISIVLIISTLVVNKQISFMRAKDMGFQKDNILFMQLKTPEIRSQIETIKAELLKDTDVNSVSVSSRMMGEVYGGWNIYDETKNEYDVTAVFADADYIKTMGLQVVEGREMSDKMMTDKENAFLINETAVKQYGWTNVIGKQINLQGFKEGRIIGVLKDFNYRSLHAKTEPLLMCYFPGDYMKRFLTVNISGRNIPDTYDYIQSTIGNFAPGQTIELKFLDSYLDNMYKSEERFNNIVTNFSALAIILGCLGLFGLVSFAAERRTKEIGIRKVLGAKASGIAFNLSVDFLKLVLISNLIAWPIAFYIMTKWLEDFAYKIDIGIWVFVIALFATMVVALITVSYHSVKAALANPIDSLKYE